MRISRISSKRTIIGGLVLTAACAAAVPATAAHAGTRVTAFHASTQAASHTARPTDTIYNCEYGDVCMYTSDPSSGNIAPEHSWKTYGCKQLHGEYGTRWVVNNQYGGATATLRANNCGQPGGSEAAIPAGYIGTTNITPANSITLNS